MRIPSTPKRLQEEIYARGILYFAVRRVKVSGSPMDAALGRHHDKLSIDAYKLDSQLILQGGEEIRLLRDAESGRTRSE